MITDEKGIQYSDKFYDDIYEYRADRWSKLLCKKYLDDMIMKHVYLPKEIATKVPKNRLMTEKEWRAIGIQQSLGWVHYAIHNPEPHIILFRRPRTDMPVAASTKKVHAQYA